MRLLAAIRTARRRTAYVPRHGYPYTIEPHEQWHQALRELHPAAFAPVATPSWVDRIFDDAR